MLEVSEIVKDRTYQISLKSTGLIIGEFISIDGFYYFSQNKNLRGVWSEEFLKSLTYELGVLNKEVNESVDGYFNFQ